MEAFVALQSCFVPALSLGQHYSEDLLLQALVILLPVYRVHKCEIYSAHLAGVPVCFDWVHTKKTLSHKNNPNFLAGNRLVGA